MKRKQVFCIILTFPLLVIMLMFSGCRTIEQQYDVLGVLPEYPENNRSYDTSSAIFFSGHSDARINEAMINLFAEKKYTNVYLNNYLAELPGSTYIVTPCHLASKEFHCQDGIYLETHIIVSIRKPGYIWMNLYNSEKARYFQAYSRMKISERGAADCDYKNGIEQAAANLFKIDEFRCALEPHKDAGAVDVSNPEPWEKLISSIDRFNAIEVIRWAFVASERGDRRADSILATYIIGSDNVCGDSKRLLSIIRRLADNGETRSQNHLGSVYERGTIVQKDLTQAFNWYKKSAEKGYAEAQYNLGRFYANGITVQKDLTLAEQWYRKAAAQQNQKAIKQLAIIQKAKSVSKRK